MRFFGRESQLSVLQEQLDQVRGAGEGRFVWVRGRRRVGKSRLIEEFLRSAAVPFVFYQAPRRPPQQALDRFAAEVAASSLPAATTLASGVSVSSWPAALALAAGGSTAQSPVAIVIDELPYLVEHDSGFPADLQAAWDRQLSGLPVLLVAIGSAGAADLHVNPTQELDVPLLSPAEIAAIIGAPDAAAALDAYLIVGGFPALAGTWTGGMTRGDFLRSALADSATPFVVNAMRIMDAEFRSRLPARQVLETIGAGEVVFSRIRSRSGITNEKSLSTALDVLTTAKGMVSGELPYAKPPGRKNKRYTVIDPHLRFWLRFVGPYVEELDRGRPDLLLARVERDWTAFRGRAVEPLVRDALRRMQVDAVVGSYWTRNNAVEVDIVTGNAPDPGSIGLVGSIKWREEARFSRDDAEALIAHRALVPGAADARLVGVARTGFAPDVPLDLALDAEAVLAAWR